MPLRLKNTYSGQEETFVPIDPEKKTVLMYSCGPTVYSYAHIGNFRSFLLGDLLRRTLERHGYQVRHVMNITDVGHMTVDHLADCSGEDKLSKAARELGMDPYTVARHFEKAFVDDARSLRIKNQLGSEATERPLHPRATEHVAEMLAMIQTLLDRGYAYVDEQGQVYFSVEKFPEYGKLSGKQLDELESGKRVAVRDEKRDPRDFALWKVDEKHLMIWNPHGPEGWPDDGWQRLQKLVPQGVDKRIKPGFPGWHIECSAMSRAHLGAEIDLHTGGEDNIFPHHECEIAQSYGAALENNPPTSFSRYWVHGRHLLVDGRKMAKSAGTFFTLRNLLDPVGSERADLVEPLTQAGFPGGGVPPWVLRFTLISVPFTQPMNFTFDALTQARASLERIQSLYDRAREAEQPGNPSAEIETLCTQCDEEFGAGLDDNLNMPRALAAVFKLITEANTRKVVGADARRVREAIDRFDAVLDVLDRRVRSGIVSKERLAAETAAAPDAPSAVDFVAKADLTTAEGIESVVLERQRSKKGKDFARADALRSALGSKGVDLEDTPQGVRWRLKA